MEHVCWIENFRYKVIKTQDNTIDMFGFKKVPGNWHLKMVLQTGVIGIPSFLIIDVKYLGQIIRSNY
jgi:hypothetical protein